LSFQPIDIALSSRFGQSGALVSDVVRDAPADRAGVEPGDVLVGVGDVMVASPEAAHAAIAALPLGTRVTLRVSREGRPVGLEADPVSAFTIAPRWRDRVVAEPVLAAADLLAPEMLAGAGIDADTTVIAIDRQAVVSPAQARRALARARGSVLVYLQNADGTRFFAVVNRAS
jgi:predicted metalloprotease with PDZ domain